MNQSVFKPQIEKHGVVFGDACRRFLSFSLRIVEYGNVTTRTANPHGEKFSHLQRLNYIVAGHPYYTCCCKKVDLSPGDLVFLPANMTLGMEEGEEVKLMFINFELCSLEAREDFYSFMEGLFPENHVTDRGDDLKNIMLEIQRIGALNRMGVALELQNLFENLFLHVVRMSDTYHQEHPEESATGARTIMNTAMAYINSNLSRPFRISEMAESINVSENYLYKLFMKNTGKSPIAFINELRIDVAKGALANPNMPVKTIGYNLGFSSASHFSNAFRKATGEGPAAYRKRISSEVMQDRTRAVK